MTVVRLRLTQGFEALLDDDDYEKIISFHHKWYAAKSRQTFYAYAKNTYGKFPLLPLNYAMSMHRLIMNAPSDLEVDHIDLNGLNNSKSNLRLVTPKQNKQNKRIYSNNSTGYNGVYQFGSKWRAQIRMNNVQIHLGTFSSPKEAALARAEAEKRMGFNVKPAN